MRGDPATHAHLMHADGLGEGWANPLTNFTFWGRLPADSGRATRTERALNVD